MPDFQYRALNAQGQTNQGRIQASDQQHAMRLLRQQGLTPTELVSPDSVGALPGAVISSSAPAGRRWFNRERSAKITSEDVLSFVQELGTLLRAGLPLDRALRVLTQMQQHPGMQVLQQDMLKAIKAGRSLSQAMVAHSPTFGPLHVNLIRAGEVSGKLPEALGYLTEHLERSKALRSSLVSALIYPAILLGTAAVSVALMLGFVVPQFKPLFSDLGDRLPWLTDVVVRLGDTLVQYGSGLLIGLLLVVVALDRWWRTDSGRGQKERLLLGIPLLGPLLLRYQISRFTGTLGTLLANGIGLIQAIGIARDGLSYSTLRVRLAPLSDAIKQGQRFSRVIADSQLLDPAALQLVALGEETGRLDTMLLELTKQQEATLQTQTRRLLTLLEPLLILSLGLVIALIIIAILLGILSVNELVA